MIYHVIILLTILTDNLVAGLRKESSNNNLFSLIVNISNTSHLEIYYPLHLNKKLFKTLFLNFTYIYSKCNWSKVCLPSIWIVDLFIQSNATTSFVFNFWSRDHN